MTNSPVSTYLNVWLRLDELSTAVLVVQNLLFLLVLLTVQELAYPQTSWLVHLRFVLMAQHHIKYTCPGTTLLYAGNDSVIILPAMFLNPGTKP